MTKINKQETAESTYTTRLLVMTLALFVGGSLMAAKFVAYYITGSAAILSDALESIINVVASGFVLYSIYLSHQPPDKTHPYGHGKIEYFAVGFEGALIILAAGAILYKAIPAFFQARMLSKLGFGILLVLVTSVVNLLVGLFLIHTGRRTRSAPVEADGKHLLTDVFTSVGVVIGLVLVRLTDWSWWDPITACAVAVNIVITGWHLVKKSFGRLMDEADPELLERIVEILNKNRRSDWIDLHQLRTRYYGNKVHVDFHLVVPRNLGLVEAHLEAKEIEKKILNSLTEVAEVIVHVDPCEDPLCEWCVQDNCQDRSKDLFGAAKPWEVEKVVMKELHRGK